MRFVHWYNAEHRHSSTRCVSPAQRRDTQDHEILAARHVLYTEARGRNPARWSHTTRDWAPVDPVALNLERESIVAARVETMDRSPMAI